MWHSISSRLTLEPINIKIYQRIIKSKGTSYRAHCKVAKNQHFFKINYTMIVERNAKITVNQPF